MGSQISSIWIIAATCATGPSTRGLVRPASYDFSDEAIDAELLASSGLRRISRVPLGGQDVGLEITGEVAATMGLDLRCA